MSSTIAAQRLGGKEIDDLLNGFVGAMVGGFELAGRLVMGVGAVVKAAVGERAAEPFVKEQEEQGDLNPFWGETVGVAGFVTLQTDVDVEPLRLETGEAAGDGLEPLADGIEMVQSLLEMEIGEVVGDQLVAQEGGELFVLLQKRVFEIGAEDVMAVLDAIDDGGQLAAHCAVQARAKDLGDLVGGQPP